MATEEVKATTIEKQTNCLGCSKPLKKISQYYREGKYYCDKKCWRKAREAKGEKSEQA